MAAMEEAVDVALQRAYYDDHWAKPGHEYANLLQLARATAVLQALQSINQRQPHILDLGCGTGWLAGILGRFGPTTAIDLSPVAIEKAQRLYPDVRFVAGDLLDRHFPDASFDVIVSVQVMDHMADHDKYLELIWNYLRPGGTLIVITTNARNMALWNPQDYARFCTFLQPIENQVTVGKLRRLLGTRYRIKKLTTLLPGYGNRGVLRILHSAKLARLLEAVGLLAMYQAVLLRLGYGLVILAVAQRSR